MIDSLLKDEKVILVGGQAIEVQQRHCNMKTDIHITTKPDIHSMMDELDKLDASLQDTSTVMVIHVNPLLELPDDVLIRPRPRDYLNNRFNQKPLCKPRTTAPIRNTRRRYR